MRPTLSGDALHPGILDAQFVTQEADFLSEAVVIGLQADAVVPAIGSGTPCEDQGDVGQGATQLSDKTSYSDREVLAFGVHHPKMKRRLPLPPLLMFDRVTNIRLDPQTGKGEVRAEKDVHWKEWFFFCHFESDPVMPGVLEVDALLQLCGLCLAHVGFEGHGRALRVGKIVFHEQVRPHHKKVVYLLDVKKITEKPSCMIFADAVAEVDGQLSAEIDGIIVGVFSDLSYSFP